ncbi:MAG: hypothetical protein ACFFDF_00425 [Candidatus Odinarchaeota archaeon]
MKLTYSDIIKKRKEIWNGNIEEDKKFRYAVAQEILNDSDLQDEIQDKPEKLIEMVFVIVDKDKNTVPFFLNEVQQDFVSRINRAVEEFNVGKRLDLKFLVLKGRQQGFTSFITAYQLACTITRKNFEGFTVADEDGNTEAIFQNKAKYAYSLLPEYIKPSEKFNNRKQFLFDVLNSSWEVKTASKNMGRSRTINFFHGSEAAFWKHKISDIQAGLGEALTKSAIQILESTANGLGEYKDLWDSGKWENCFYEWWKTDEYSQEFETQDKEDWFKAKVNQGKEWIWERCRFLCIKKLTWNQVYWYYNKWNNYINGELIKQEYPCTPEEAFLNSGNCVFNKEKVMQRIEVLKEAYNEKPYKTGEFIITWNNPDRLDYPVGYKWTNKPEQEGQPIIRMYEDAKQGYPYVIGGDTKGEGSDKFTGTVINNTTGNRVATLYNPTRNILNENNVKGSKYYAAQIWALGMYYNTALSGIETNWNTYPIELLTDWHYPRQYVREKKDTFTGAITKAYGWRTDGNTRPLIIEKETTVVDEDIELFNDIETLKEMLTFVEDEKGRPDAESGKHDDLLFSDMIANEIRVQQTRVNEKIVEEDEDDEDDRRSNLGSWFD